VEKIGFNSILSFFKKEKAPPPPSQAQGVPRAGDSYGGQVQQPSQPVSSSNLKAAADILLQKGNPSKLEKLWQHPEVMNYYGPGVVDRNGLLFTRGTTGPDGDLFVCLDSTTGGKRWDISAPDGSMSGLPILDDDDNLFQGYNDGTLKMLDKATGQELKSIGFDRGDVVPFRGNDGRLYIENNSRLYTIDTSSLSKKFYADFNGKGCWPVVAADGMVVVVSGEHTVTAIDPVKAQVKWSVNPEGMVRCPVNIGPDGTVYAPSTDHRLHALDRDTGKEKWNFETQGYCLTTPAIDGDGTVYLGSCDNKLYALDPRSGGEKWHRDVRGEVRVNPVLTPDGVLGVASDRNVLYGFDTANGDGLFEQPADSYMHFPPLFGSNGTIFISANNATLYGFKGTYSTAKIRTEQIDNLGGQPRIETDENYITIDEVKLKIHRDQVLASIASFPRIAANEEPR
jgi:outer membrane protein assembly factor BamB